MIVATVSGNLGADAETHDAGDTTVTNFNVASNSKVKGEKVTTWVRCALWGKRGEALAEYLQKGTKVTVVGTLELEVYNDKPQLNLRVDQLELMSGGSREESDRPKAGTARRPAQHREKTAKPYNEQEDDVPF